MSNASVRCLAIVLLIGLPIQYAAVGLVGEWVREPWPALVLPAFQDVWDGKEEISVPRVRFVVTPQKGAPFDVELETIWTGLPRSQHAGFMREQCRPESLSGTPHTERCTTPTATGWIHHRLRTQFPDITVQRVDVVWEKVQFDVHDPASRHTPQTTPLDTLTLSI